MDYRILRAGESRSFPATHPLLEKTSDAADVLLIIGADAGRAYRDLTDLDRYRLILIELGTECLGEHTGESRGLEGGKVLGFARYRMGNAEATDLVEIVRQPATADSAIESARTLFSDHGLRTAVCRDFPGRIIDRLVRPYYNAALSRLDAGLASADDLDKTLRLGLGYPEGPIERLERTGLADHCAVSEALHEALGEAAYAPARRARVARAHDAG